MTTIQFNRILNQKHDRFDEAIGHLPDGWFPPLFCRIIYNLALNLNGPFLEIGSFVGRSTACIALGIRDSGSDKTFFTTDFHFDSLQAFYDYYKPLHGNNTSVPVQFVEAIETGGTLHALRENLRRIGVETYVEVLRGDFSQVVPRLRYSFIFCDATHDEAEIQRNCPQIRNLLGPGGVLVCDDVMSQNMVDSIARFIPFSYVRRIAGRLLVGITQ